MVFPAWSIHIAYPQELIVVRKTMYVLVLGELEILTKTAKSFLSSIVALIMNIYLSVYLSIFRDVCREARGLWAPPP